VHRAVVRDVQAHTAAAWFSSFLLNALVNRPNRRHPMRRGDPSATVGLLGDARLGDSVAVLSMMDCCRRTLADLTVNSEIGPIGRKGAPDEIAEKPLMSSRGPAGVNRFSGIGCENSGDDAVGCHAASHRTFADRAPGDDDLMLDPQVAPQNTIFGSIEADLLPQVSSTVLQIFVLRIEVWRCPASSLRSETSAELTVMFDRSQGQVTILSRK
jgi:hypothetical protein